MVLGQVSTELYDDGSIRAEGRIESGKKEGVWKFYFPDGTLSAQEEYLGGELNGIVLNYDFSGNLIAREHWENDVITDSAWYYKDNHLWRKGKYENGVYQGNWIFYHLSGNVQQTGYYDKGVPNGTWKTYDTNGYLVEEGSYRDGQPDGLWKFYDHGTLTMYGHYSKGEQVGEWYKVLKNGKEKRMKY